MPRIFKISSKSSSDRCFLSLKRSLIKNSLEGREDSVSLCPCPSSIQNPCTRCSTMLAQACSNSSWLRAFSSSLWSCPSSWPCPSSSSWCSSSSSSKMLSAEKHYKNIKEYIIRHLMTGPKGNSEFYFPDRDPQCSLWRSQGELKKLQLKKTAKKYLLDTSWQCKLFPGKWPDHLQVKSWSCRFSGELMSFVRPRELVSFDPWRMRQSPKFL